MNIVKVDKVLAGHYGFISLPALEAQQTGKEIAY
jgi:hypothetical protein